jgi:hypothetical protein
MMMWGEGVGWVLNHEGFNCSAMRKGRIKGRVDGTSSN